MKALLSIFCLVLSLIPSNSAAAIDETTISCHQLLNTSFGTDIEAVKINRNIAQKATPIDFQLWLLAFWERRYEDGDSAVHSFSELDWKILFSAFNYARWYPNGPETLRIIGLFDFLQYGILHDNQKTLPVDQSDLGQRIYVSAFEAMGEVIKAHSRHPLVLEHLEHWIWYGLSFDTVENSETPELYAGRFVKFSVWEQLVRYLESTMDIIGPDLKATEKGRQILEAIASGKSRSNISAVGGGGDQEYREAAYGRLQFRIKNILARAKMH